MLSDAESMAIAVLKGDLHAARALAEYLIDECQPDVTHIRPLPHKLSVNTDKLRFLIFVNNPDITIDLDHVTEAIQAWLHNGAPLVLYNINRVEIYQLPD